MNNFMQNSNLKLKNQNWPTKKLGEVAEIYQGGKSGLTKKDYVESGFPAFSAMGQDGFTKKAFDSGFAVILSSIGARCGKCFYAEGKWTALANTQVIKFKDRTTARFMYYYLNDENKWPRYGSAQPFIVPSIVKRLRVPFPPLPIQQKIVERLDAIKKAQELNDKQIALAEELKRSFIYRLEPQLKQWQRVPLAQCVDFFQLGLIKSKKDYSEEGVPYLKMDAIQANGEIDFTKVIKVNASEEEIQEYKLCPGDFLFNTRNTKELVGKSAVFEGEGLYLFNNNILRLRFKNILPLFLNAFFHTTQGKKLLNSKKKGTTSVWAIYQRDLFKIKIPLPPLEIQKKIVEKLSAVQEYKKKLLKQKQLLQELFESVLHKSMKGELI